MNFTANPLEREMKRRPRPQAPRPDEPPEGSRCCGCPYWRGIPCGGAVPLPGFFRTSGHFVPKVGGAPEKYDVQKL